MLVLNTNSNTTSVSAPKACPSITVPSSKIKVAIFFISRPFPNCADYSTVVQTISPYYSPIPCQRIGYWILNPSICNNDATHAALERLLRAQHFLLHATLRRFTRRRKLTLRQLPNKRGLIWEILHQPWHRCQQ